MALFRCGGGSKQISWTLVYYVADNNTNTTRTYTTTKAYDGLIVCAIAPGSFTTTNMGSATYTEMNNTAGQFGRKIRLYVNVPAGATFTCTGNSGYNHHTGLEIYSPY